MDGTQKQENNLRKGPCKHIAADLESLESGHRHGEPTPRLAQEGCPSLNNINM